MRVLVIEDDAALNGILAKRLAEEGHSVDCCFDGRDGLDYAEAADYDCIVLDWMLPKMDGLTLLRRLRGGGNHANVLLLTAKDSIEDRVAGLDAGADDYLSKPFSTPELLARVRAMLRRKDNFTPDILTFHDTVLNRSTYELIFEESAQILSGKEFQVMEVLMQKPGVIVPTEEFMTHIWGWNTSVDTSVVWVHISNIRRKIEKIKAPVRIRFIRNAGYVLEADV